MADAGESLFPPERRAAAEARCAAATPGWYEDVLLFIGADALGNGRGGFTLNCRRRDGSWEYTDAEEQANIEFAAHARADLPAALAEIARLEAEVARLRAEPLGRPHGAELVDPDALAAAPQVTGP